MEIKGKNILVTGASGGIGTSISKQLSDEGANLYLQYNRDKIEQSDFPTAKLLKADFNNKDEIRVMFDSITKLDVLVNVVGIEVKNPNLLDLRTWREIFEINLFSLVAVTNEALKLIEEGVIVNITSIVGNPNIIFSGQSGDSVAYPASKAALHKLTEGIAAAYSPKIRAVSISPGYVRTQMWDVFSEEDIKSCENDVPLKKFVKVDEIAKSVIYVIENDSITGTNLVVDGGLGLRIIY